MTDENIEETIKQLVIARLRSTPPDMGIIIGLDSNEKLSPLELISEIEKDSQLGKEYIEMDMEFLRAMQKGLLYG